MTQSLSAPEMLAVARQLIADEAAAMAGVAGQLGDSFVEAARLMLACTGKVFTTGMGTSGATARRMAHLLSVTGTPSVFTSAADGLHGGLGMLTATDILIAISKGGESDELNEFVRRARDRGVKIISITGSTTCTLARLGDIVLQVTNPAGVEPGGMIAMGSTLCVATVGDALALVLMQLRDYPWASFEHTHPGGAVGKRIAEEQQAG